MTNLLFIFANEFKKSSSQVSAFANDSWKGNFWGIDFRKSIKNLQNSGKLVPQKFVFNRTDIFKFSHKEHVSGKWPQTKKKKKTIEKRREKILKWSEAFVHSSYTDFLF